MCLFAIKVLYLPLCFDSLMACLCFLGFLIGIIHAALNFPSYSLYAVIATVEGCAVFKGGTKINDPEV